jgi:hypothetical protein
MLPLMASMPLHRMYSLCSKAAMTGNGQANYNFSYEDEHFYLSDAETVVWHKSDPNAIDQKEYDFKSYFLRSTVVSDCGTITCNELQLTGDNDKMRVKLADFHYTDSLVTFADLL